MPASDLDRILICASNAAYEVVADQTPLPRNPSDLYLTGAGFLEPPLGLDCGPDLIDACLVGEIAEGLVVAFRGTLSLNLHQIPSLRDWLGDLQSATITTQDFPGAVHQGFYKAWSVLFPKVLAELKTKLAATSGRPVYLTGHSKGGSLAALVAYSLFQAGITPARVATFAAAKPADAAFSLAYNATPLAQIHARYEYDFDIVPHLPLSDRGFLDILASLPVIGDQFKVEGERYDYQPVGPLAYIQSNHAIISDTATLRSTRDFALATQILEGHFAQILAEHSIACGSGYMTAIAPGGVCQPPGT
jgi:hypothetical protein